MSAVSPENRRISAPGKLILSGEYAVLEGAEAVTVAVSRRARAHLAETPLKELSPFVRAVQEEMAESTAFGGIGRSALHAIRRVSVDTSALYAQDGTKLGLGSSAAATVAAAACAVMDDSGVLPRELIHGLAHRAHGLAQGPLGARGSGADVAACTYGGVLAVRMVEDGQPVEVRSLSWPAGAHMVYVWTGQAAHSPTLVAHIRQLRIGDRRRYETVINDIATASARVIQALEQGDVAGLLAGVEAGAQAVAGLGEAASAPLIVPAHDTLAAIARDLGGAAKPTGAAGGDIAVALFDNPDAARACADAVRAKGLVVLDDMTIAETGVTID